ncbi:hypothetical protein ABS71_11485 [bacterium SCN 62-11]|nr:DUF4349 domain-containing protein [Candidatus Eremiobacteraeota bacterium]ODT67091.1 MAG: hypothetical protein ABS71_11485 [bacterium SCN 62-11]
MRNVAIVLLLLGLLAGCSGSPPESTPAPQASAVPTVATTPGAVNPSRKLVKNGALTLRVVALTETSEQIRAKAAELGGFISNSRFDVNSQQAESATIEAKVPSEKLDPFMQDLESLGKVLSKSETAEDVTEQFVDMEARRSNLQREEERLLVILKSAGGLKDLLAVEQELARVRGELEQIQGKLKHLNYQADYSTVAVTLTTTAQGSTVAFWDLSGTVGNAWMLLKLCLRLVLQAAIYFVFLLPLGLPAWWAHRRATRKPEES